ncbi:MAG TPA: dihydroorotase [Casimicrobiaceae bacterium]|nr:dihydroorotase [Casimicrobiaceae bacterium]
MHSLAIRNGRLIDPATGLDRVTTLVVRDGRIASIDAAGDDARADAMLDAHGLVVAPGLVDLSARLREPGLEHKATLESELRAAIAGGVTSLACPPDTDPPLDEPGLVEMLKHRARMLNQAHVYPIGALTQRLGGEALTEMGELAEAGCIAFSNADHPIADTQVLLRALQYAKSFGHRVWLRPEDPWLARGGVAHEGEVATRLGLASIPTIAETIALATILALVRETGSRVHVARISSASAVAMLRAAKAEGLPVTADVGIHHLHLSDVDIGWFDPQARFVPPLRGSRDRDALRTAVADGTIDAICSDHAPADDDAKLLPFAEADPGATGLEVLLPLTLQWAREAKVPLGAALDRITRQPADVLGVDAGTLRVGAPADLCVFDADEPWRITRLALASQGKNTPYAGLEVVGRVRWTIVGGKVVHSAEAAR